MRQHVITHQVLGGKNNNPEGFSKGFDVVFTVEFKVSIDITA